MKQQFKAGSFFGYFVRYGESSWGGNSGHGGDSLESAVGEAIKAASYYVAIGYSGVRFDIHEQCARCYGAGDIVQGRKRRKCPGCRGNGKKQYLTGVRFDMCCDFAENFAETLQERQSQQAMEVVH